MAVATKTYRTLQASASNTAGSTTTGTGLSLLTALGGTLVAVITNGGTGPTVACDLVVEVSGDNSTWYEFARMTSQTGNSTVTTFRVRVPESVLYVRSRFTGNTGQTVTVEAYFHELTSIG
jgi:hypothetical protein